MPKQPKQEKTQKLNTSERAGLFQAVVELGEVGILVLNGENLIGFANNMASHIMGYRVDELVSKDFRDFLDEKNKKKFQSLKKDYGTSTTKLYQDIEITTASASPLVIDLPHSWHNTFE